MNRNSLKVIRYRMRVKWKLILYKGGKCEICGYNKPVPGAYHFHHRNCKTKLFTISGSTLGFNKLKEEVDKCDLLCACCHAEEHDKAWKENRQEVISQSRSEIKTEIKCKKCDKLFLPKRKEQQYCSKSCVPKIQEILYEKEKA